MQQYRKSVSEVATLLRLVGFHSGGKHHERKQRGNCFSNTRDLRRYERSPLNANSVTNVLGKEGILMRRSHMPPTYRGQRCGICEHNIYRRHKISPRH